MVEMSWKEAIEQRVRVEGKYRNRKMKEIFDNMKGGDYNE